MPEMSGWRFCTKCFALFFDGDAGKGLCPSDGLGHVAQGFHFVVAFGHDETPTMQTAWQQCGKCMVMFYDGFAAKGRCDAGGAHEHNRRLPFALRPDDAGDDHHQASWEFCEKCFALYFDGFPTNGHCGAGGAHQRQANAFRFVLHHDPQPKSTGFGDDNVGIGV